MRNFSPTTCYPMDLANPIKSTLEPLPSQRPCSSMLRSPFSRRRTHSRKDPCLDCLDMPNIVRADILAVDNREDLQIRPSEAAPHPIILDMPVAALGVLPLSGCLSVYLSVCISFCQSSYGVSEMSVLPRD